MAANIASIRLTLEDGTDLADKLNPRLTELTLSEKRGGEADELSVTLQNHDGKLVPPAPGRVLTLALGWTSGTNVPLGLVVKGRFKVDEVEMSGPPDIVTIRARSADLTGSYTKRRTHSWKSTTLGAMLTTIAGRNGLSAVVHPDLSSKAVAAIEQHGKSDMAFVRDLGERYDALATWKDRQLVFMPVGSSTSASGKQLPTAQLTRRNGWSWRFAHAQRDEADGAEAEWHDAQTGKRRKATSGSGKKPRKLKRVYSSEAEAQQAADAAASKGKRGAWTFEYELAFADPAIEPNHKLKLQGWNSQIDGINWLVSGVETAFGAGGMTQRLTLESA